MRRGGRIVSSQVIKPLPRTQTGSRRIHSIAESKHAGEDALRAMTPNLVPIGTDFVVVSGDMVDGSIIVRLLERRNPDAVTDRRSHGDLPSIEGFAGAIAAATHEPHAIGDTIHVGGHDYLTT